MGEGESAGQPAFQQGHTHAEQHRAGSGTWFLSRAANVSGCSSQGAARTGTHAANWCGEDASDDVCQARSLLECAAGADRHL